MDSTAGLSRRPLALDRFERGAHSRRDFAGHRAAVGVAEGRGLRAGPRGDAKGLEGVLGVVFPAVEEMLGVVEDAPSGSDDEPNRVVDHGEVFLGRDAQGAFRLKERGLADDRNDGRLGGYQLRQARVVLRFRAFATRHSKGANQRGLWRLLRDALKKGSVLFVRRGVPALDVVDPEIVEPTDRREFVVQRKGDALELGAVAQGGVVKFYSSWHKRRSFPVATASLRRILLGVCRARFRREPRRRRRRRTAR